MNILRIFIIVLGLMFVGCNEDGNFSGMETHAEYLHKRGVKNWRSKCDWHGRSSLKNVVSRVPVGGKVVKIITCDTIIVFMDGECYMVTQGFRSHSWTQAKCPKDIKND